MDEEKIKKFKNNIIAIGHLLWEKDLASGLNGNISARVDQDTILITATGTCLGLLQEKDILMMKLDGEMIDQGRVSTEKLLHTEIYKNYPDHSCVVHTHTTYTNAYFLSHAQLEPKIFETKVYLGNVQGVEQNTPAVTDAKPVMDALKNNNIVALRNHGVVAMGLEHFDCFLLIQGLEDACKIDAISRLYSSDNGTLNGDSNIQVKEGVKKYKLFSQEQIDDIVKYVNEDEKLADLGAKTNMDMELAIKLDETSQTYRFTFEKGKITGVAHDDKAEFVVSAPEKVWRAVFNREIDPFVATTQKKMQLDGDFAKISKWYAPCSRVFEIWAMVPVE